MGAGGSVKVRAAQPIPVHSRNAAIPSQGPLRLRSGQALTRLRRVQDDKSF